MVVSSRSSRGRIKVSKDQEHDSSESSSPITTCTSTTATQDHDAAPLHPHQDDASLSRVKRNRIASLSDHENLQKRRRFGRSSGPPQVHIPLRSGRAVHVPEESVSPSHAGNNTSTCNDNTNNGNNLALPPPPPPTTLPKQDSSISNSPANSPALRPQYDQFKRIEEKAQRIVKKNGNNAASKDDKRTLRSEHGSSRSKTELAQYFPAFDDMLSLEPADPDVLTVKTPIVLVDDTPGYEAPPTHLNYFRLHQLPHNAEVINLEQFTLPTNSAEDPLTNAIYLKAHQKAERHEKQMKNGDKERAQHEKYQLERLLEELRGPDWLKTLGISGITDTEKKRYEIKRALFIRETKALIDKFRRWKEEEKRRKLEKQQQHLHEEMEANDEDALSVSSRFRKPRLRIKHGIDSRSRSQASSRPASVITEPAPDSSELDALASQQLLEEVKLATAKRLKPALSVPQSSLPLPDILNRPFTSFFEKRHIRDAAVSGRNRGRKVYAFGHEVPELEESDFELPDSMLTEDAIKTSQRRRRRMMRSTDD